MSAGKVNLGAFRTYPKVSTYMQLFSTHTHTCTLVAWCVQNYKAPEDQPDEYQTIPLEKIEDFGVHCRQ